METKKEESNVLKNIDAELSDIERLMNVTAGLRDKIDSEITDIEFLMNATTDLKNQIDADLTNIERLIKGPEQESKKEKPSELLKHHRGIFRRRLSVASDKISQLLRKIQLPLSVSIIFVADSFSFSSKIFLSI